MSNIILDTDSYKASHFKQYPPGTTSTFCYYESRRLGDYADSVFFGLQYILEKYLTHRVTEAEVLEAKDFLNGHGEPFPYEGWMHIVTHHDGKLPVRIRAVPEGSIIPYNQVLMTVESTCETAFWLPGWLETQLVRVWYPSTVATKSRSMKKLIKSHLERTADEPETKIDFALHDFGARGVSSRESAGIGGAAHLVNFKGSDTIEGVRVANKYYHAQMAGFSIPAAEHSTVTAWGVENEIEAYRNMLVQFADNKPAGTLLAVVSDSYNLWAALSMWGFELRQHVIDSKCTLVIRLDSGEPKKVVRESLIKLEEYFGSTTNSKGYRVLNNVRVIQGDGMRDESALEDVLYNAMLKGYSTENVAFGMGGGLLQLVDRDTLNVAYKLSNLMVNGQYRDVHKDPVDDHYKASKAGRLDLVFRDGMYQTVPILWGQRCVHDTEMYTVFEDGEVRVTYDLDWIRDTVDRGEKRANT